LIPGDQPWYTSTGGAYSMYAVPVTPYWYHSRLVLLSVVLPYHSTRVYYHVGFVPVDWYLIYSTPNMRVKHLIELLLFVRIFVRALSILYYLLPLPETGIFTIIRHRLHNLYYRYYQTGYLSTCNTSATCHLRRCHSICLSSS